MNKATSIIKILLILNWNTLVPEEYKQFVIKQPQSVTRSFLPYLLPYHSPPQKKYETVKKQMFCSYHNLLRKKWQVQTITNGCFKFKYKSTSPTSTVRFCPLLAYTSKEQRQTPGLFVCISSLGVLIYKCICKPFFCGVDPIIALI